MPARRRRSLALVNGWLCLLLVVGACANDGSRARCAEGGALNACGDIDRTPPGACWRLVDCAAIPINGDQWNWAQCVDDISSLQPIGQEAVIDCIAASTCDALKVDGSPLNPNRDDEFCWLIVGGR